MFRIIEIQREDKREIRRTRRRGRSGDYSSARKTRQMQTQCVPLAERWDPTAEYKDQ